MWAVVSFADSYDVDLEPLLASVGPSPTGRSDREGARAEPAEEPPRATADEEPAPSQPAAVLPRAEPSVNWAAQAAAVLLTGAVEARLRQAEEKRPNVDYAPAGIRAIEKIGGEAAEPRAEPATWQQKATAKHAAATSLPEPELQPQREVPTPVRLRGSNVAPWALDGLERPSHASTAAQRAVLRR